MGSMRQDPQLLSQLPRMLRDAVEQTGTVSTPENQLPEFGNPPVIEVALGVQFDPIFGLMSSRLVRFWADKLRDRFPKTQETQPLPPEVEWFGAPPGAIQFAIQLTPTAAPNRWIFSDQKMNELVQIQQDRFVRNWRKIGEGDTYPRYPAIRKALEEDFDEFATFIKGEGLAAPIPNQCEVSYVNHIDVPEGASHGEPERILACWKGENSDTFLGKPETVETTSRYVIRRNNEPVGRLHIACRPVFFGPKAKPVFLLTLTARGRPSDANLQGVLDFLDLGREYVVKGFASVTTLDAHKEWRRQR